MLVWEIITIVGVCIVLMILMSSTHSLKVANETLLRRIIGMENAMAAVEKSCTISSNTIAKLDQTITPKVDDLERKIAVVAKQSNLTTSQQQALRRSLQEIRQSLAHTNARSHFRPNTIGSPLD